MPRQYKVCLKNSDSSIKEIRNVAYQDNFYELRQQLQSLFPCLVGKDFTITWIDLEGDEITIGSDSEYQLAKSDLHKIYVKIPSASASACTYEQVVHRNIFCDNCNGGVIGYRYKCIQCEDYDLCSKCEMKGAHSSHYMIRLPQPLHGHDIQSFMFCMKKFLKFTRMHAPRRHGTCEQSRKRRSHDFGPVIDSIFPWLEPLLPERNSSTRKAEEAKSFNENPTQNPAEHKEEKDPKTLFKIYRDENDELNIVIDIDSNKSQNCKVPNAKNTCSAPKMDENHSKSDEGACSMSDIEKKSETENLSINKVISKEITDEQQKSSSDAKKEKEVLSDTSSTSSQGSIMKATDEWTLLDKNESPRISRASSVLSNLNEIGEKQETESAPPSVEEKDSAAKSIYPHLPEKSKIYHSNSIIQAAVESMIDMGFSNQCGLLTYLLTAENGNINNVLDLLQGKNTP